MDCEVPDEAGQAHEELRGNEYRDSVISRVTHSSG